MTASVVSAAAGSSIAPAAGGSSVSAASAQSAVAAAGSSGSVLAAGSAGGVAGSGAAGSGASQGTGGGVGQSGSGLASQALALVAIPIQPGAGRLTLDLSQANTFRVTLTQSVTMIELTNLPASGKSERVTVYFAQDGAGSRTVSGWTGVRWSGGEAPTLSTTPYAVDCIVLDVMDSGATVLGNLVGLSYS